MQRSLHKSNKRCKKSSLLCLGPYDPNDDLMAIMGDFNCDMDRNNRFDAIFKSFVFNNNFFNSLNYFDQEISYSYKNGDYKSTIDHILCNHALSQKVTNGQIMDENCNNSDHNPVYLSIELNLPINEILSNSNSRTNKKFHFLIGTMRLSGRFIVARWR